MLKTGRRASCEFTPGGVELRPQGVPHLDHQGELRLFQMVQTERREFGAAARWSRLPRCR